MEYLKKFDNNTQYEADKDNLIRPNVSYCVEENEVHYNPIDYSIQYLTFIALEDGTFKFSGNSVSYSLDDGKTWTELASNTNSPIITAGSKILWKAEGLTIGYGGIGSFSSSGRFNVQGNAMSLLYGDNFKGQTDLTGKNYAFKYLFKYTRIISAKNLSLPATTLAYNCYERMFEGCSYLTTAPELPATTLTSNCYAYMFYYCTTLNYIKCLATVLNGGTNSWLLNNAARDGTFVKAASMNDWLRGDSGIPYSWTIINA